MVQKAFHILDTSVVIKWFSYEEGNEKALLYLTQAQEGKIHILVPSIFLYEFGNALLSKKISSSEVKEFVKQVLQLEPLIAEIDEKDIIATYTIATVYQLSFYDAVYVHLAYKHHGSFITADKKLFLKIHKNFPKAKLL